MYALFPGYLLSYVNFHQDGALPSRAAGPIPNRTAGRPPEACSSRFQMLTGQLAVVATPVPLIVDTDIGGGSCRDVDDVGAICMANALADNGEVDLLAVVVNTRPVQGVRAVAAINAWYGRDVPIGAYRPPVPDDGLWPHPPILPWIGTLPHGTSDPLPYVDRLAAEWPSCPQVQP